MTGEEKKPTHTEDVQVSTPGHIVHDDHEVSPSTNMSLGSAKTRRLNWTTGRSSCGLPLAPRVDVTNLKLAKDGQTVLIPQPSDNPDDPLNWSSFKKHMILICVAFGAFAGDFGSGAGVGTIVVQGIEWNMSPVVVNYATNLNVIMCGVSGILWMPLLNYWGRTPVLFWSSVLGCCFHPGLCRVTQLSCVLWVSDASRRDPRPPGKQSAWRSFTTCSSSTSTPGKSASGTRFTSSRPSSAHSVAISSSARSAHGARSSGWSLHGRACSSL